MNSTHYDRFPRIVARHAAESDAARGWPAVVAQLKAALSSRPSGSVLTIDAYPGADLGEIRRRLPPLTGDALVLDPERCLKTRSAIEAMIRPYLTDDRVFGRMAPFAIADFFDADLLRDARSLVKQAVDSGRAVFVVGTGARLIHPGTVFVYADMPRWEIQLRYRKGLANWCADNGGEDFLRKYKRGYFVEWRAADRHKFACFDDASFFLDTTVADDPKLVSGDAMRAALSQAVQQPFRVVPFFDPGVWGGQWMRRKFDLPPDPPNYAWGFDCVPEENSLLIAFGDTVAEVPALNVVVRHAEPLLGSHVYARFGAEFPIRFDFLDTMEGGNLSLQVHPTVAYIREHFGLTYTQDESYYMLDAGADAAVYLGLRNGITRDDFVQAVELGGTAGELDVERYVNRWPARRHDHFSIPAGTVHCAGRNCLVLEISATPYIFTFKLWDWGRVGLDGKPRPIHIGHARQVIDAGHDTDWVRRTVLDQVETIAAGEGWREERTGLHPLEFIETRRHWFTAPVDHVNDDSVHVLNLIEGARAMVESPEGLFEPFPVNYAETFIVPAAVGRYRIRPLAAGPHATIRASVRP
jgi:mannose-6-phosphate isomerase class I